MGAKPRQAKLTVRKGSVSKYYSDPIAAELERVKSRAAYAVSQEVGTFTTPEILEQDTHSTTWRRLPNVMPLASDLRNEVDFAITHHVGVVLAQVHERLQMPRELSINAQPPLSDNLVTIHGDFSLNNVQLDASTRQVVVFDWSTAPWLGSFTRASQHLDMCILLINLFYRRPGQRPAIEQPEALTREFLAGYGEIRDPRVAEMLPVLHHVLWRFVSNGDSWWRQTLRSLSFARLVLEVKRLSKD